MIHPLIAAGILTAAAFPLIGCSSVQLTHHSTGIEPPFCRNGFQDARAAVYWDAAWRRDQKEIELREKIVEEGIGSFFGPGGCIETVAVSRTAGDRRVAESSDGQIASDARSRGADKAIVMRVEELGPNLIFYLSPVLWQTRNEVLLRIRILDARDGTLEADTSSRWCRGGAFMLIGAGNLRRDLKGILGAIFTGTGE